MGWGKVYTVLFTSIWSLVSLYGVYHMISGNQVDINLVLTLFSIGLAVNTAVNGALLKASHDSLSQKIASLSTRIEDHFIYAHKKEEAQK